MKLKFIFLFDLISIHIQYFKYIDNELFKYLKKANILIGNFD